jgi:putative membrane protein
MDSAHDTKRLLTSDQRQQVAEAIKLAESLTDAELVTILIDKSDNYWFIPTLWASVISLCTGGLSLFEGLLFDVFQGWRFSGTDLFILQWALFLLLALVFRWPPLLRRLIPASIMRQRAFHMARTQFLNQGLHRTLQAQGVLLFVSEFEHYVEVLADDGVSSLIDDTHWQSVVNDFVADVASRRTLQGFLKAIEKTGALLALHCPPTHDKGDINELPNHMVVIEYCEK